jgi:polyhydroxyalkanoate synthase subunit PhaC
MTSPRPDELLEAFWSQTASLWDIQVKSWQQFFEAGQTMVEQTGGMPEPMQQWLQAQQQAWQQWGEALNQVPKPVQGAQADPLADAVHANLRSALEVLSQATESMAARMEASDPKALAAIWSGLAAEYQRDLADLSDKLKPARSDELAGIAQELSGTSPSPQARRYLERFVETMRVKATQGAEHYVDPSQVTVAPTPRELVYENGSLQLYRYRANAEATHEPGRPPVLLIYSIINRAWILDLIPGFSVIAHLLERGLDVYITEWKPAEPGCTDTLDDFVDPWLDGAVQRVSELSGHEQVGLFGYCIGGTIAAIYAARHPDRVRSLITLTTPLVSSGSGVLELLINPTLFPMDTIVAANRGVVPGKVVRHSIMAIKPYLEVLKWKAYYENLHDDRVMVLFEPIDRWANDNPDLPGAVFQSFVQEIYQDDRLARGETRIHGEPVDLKHISAPLLNLVAEDDWIVPRAAAERVAELVGSTDTRTEIIPGPHVGIIMDPRTRYAWDLIADHVIEHARS